MTARIALCVTLLLARASVTTAAFVTNGNFQTGDLSGWSWQPTTHAEPQMTTDVVNFNTATDATSLAFRVNPGGDQSYASGSSGGGTLSQDVFLTSGITYRITMDAAIQCVLPLPNASTGTISFYLGDAEIGSFGPGSIGGNAILRATFAGTYDSPDSRYYRLAVVFNRQFGNYPTADYPTPRIYHFVDNERFTLDSETLNVTEDGPRLEGFVFAKRVIPKPQRTAPSYWLCIRRGTLVEVLPG